MSVRSRARRVAATIALSSAAAMCAATPSSAATGNAYLVINNSNCVGGGKIVQITGAVDNIWSGGDAGDNIIYPRVRLNDTNTFNGRALCSRSWYQGGAYWINIVWKQFRPTRNNQTFWF